MTNYGPYKDFKEFLQYQHMQDEPCVLDYDLPDAYNNWICNLDYEDWLALADKYARIYHEQQKESEEQ